MIYLSASFLVFAVLCELEGSPKSQEICKLDASVVASIEWSSLAHLPPCPLFLHPLFLGGISSCERPPSILKGALATQFSQFHFRPISSALKNVLEQNLKHSWIRPNILSGKAEHQDQENVPGCLLGPKSRIVSSGEGKDALNPLTAL